MKRLFTLVAVVMFSSSMLMAQEEKPYRRGLSFMFDVEVGQGLIAQDARLSKYESDGGGVAMTLSQHMLRERLSVGLGINLRGYGRPQDYAYRAAFLSLRYRPLKRLRRMAVEGRLGMPIADLHSSLNVAKYHTLTDASISVGWEFPRLLGSVGLYPSVGISYCSYRYQTKKDEDARYRDNPKARGNQMTAFVRVGVTLN